MKVKTIYKKRKYNVNIWKKYLTFHAQNGKMKPSNPPRAKLIERPHAPNDTNQFCSFTPSVQSRLHQPRDTHTNRFFCFPLSMKLIDESLVQLSKQYGNQDNARDPVVIARYMSTTSPAVWLVTDFDPETGEATAFKSGIGETEWDCFNLLDLARMRIPTTMNFYDSGSKRHTIRQSFGRVVRDHVFTPRRLSECLREIPEAEGDKKPNFNLADLQELFGKREEHKREHAHASDK